MPVKFQNYAYSFQLNAKPVFVPSYLGERIGQDIKRRVERLYLFAPHFYHLRRGGHVAALHSHRKNKYFCKVDLKNFFYSVARNRVVRALREVGVSRAEHYGKWSCVKNPYEAPSYALPYGFVQSPILATLVLDQSHLGVTVKNLRDRLTVSIYVDDISLSSNDINALFDGYSQVCEAVETAGFSLSPEKSVSPCDSLTVFNCQLQAGKTFVTPDRKGLFLRKQPSPTQLEGFERYVHSVERGNSQ